MAIQSRGIGDSSAVGDDRSWHMKPVFSQKSTTMRFADWATTTDTGPTEKGSRGSEKTLRPRRYAAVPWGAATFPGNTYEQESSFVRREQNAPR
ncbi:hypothetical protein MRX96_017584 [Rhipicephalus microplus]